MSHKGTDILFKHYRGNTTLPLKRIFFCETRTALVSSFCSNKIGKATSKRSGIVTQGKLPYAEPNGFTRQVANTSRQSENSAESQEANSDNLNPDSSAKVVAPVSA